MNISRQACVSVLCLIATPLAFADEEVTVIGSRFARSVDATTAPVIVIDKVQLDASGLISVGDILQDLPSQLGGINTQFNNGGDGSTRIDLRGLGSERTLVLLNGQRIVAGGTGADASVDLNMIPLAIVSRIEVLKGGASAVYGSGAIGGVVNIVTRDDFRGSEGDAYLGSSGESDGTTYGLNLMLGHGGDDGGFVLGANYARQEALWAGDRGYSAMDRSFDYELGEAYQQGSSSIPNGLLFRSDDESDPGNALYQSEVVANCPSGMCTRDGPGGPWRDFDPNADAYNYQRDNYLITPSERFSLFGSGHKQLGGVRVFGEILYTNRQSEQRLAPTPLFAYQNIISRDSIYNPYGLDVYLNRRLIEAGERKLGQDVDMLRVVAGVDGELPGAWFAKRDWTWDLSVNHGRVSADQAQHGDIVFSRLNQGTGPSFVDEVGTPRCGTQGPLPGPGDDDVIAGCLPVNLLGVAGSVTPEMLDYLGFQATSRGHNEETVMATRLGGRVFDTRWNGYMSAAVGADYRDVSGDFIPDAITASGDTSGNPVSATSGSYDVTEAYVELSFVPVTNREWAQRIELNAAARNYRYNSFESGTVWDAGALWRTERGVTVRGNFATAFRGASIGELHSESYDFLDFGQDPCDSTFGSLDDPNVAARCAAEGLAPTFESDYVFFVPAITGGNRQLRAESAETLTAGIVYEPRWLAGLSLSVDYFDISVRRGITQISSFQILSNCYFNADADRRNCDLIERDPATGFIDLVDARINNHGATRTSGFDATIAYAHDFGGLGRLSLAVDLTYLDNFEQEVAGSVTEGAGVYDLGVYPRFKSSSSLRWDRGPVGVGINFRTISGITECEFSSCGDPFVRENFSRKVPASYVTDLLATYQIESSLGRSTLRLGINNVFDEPPAAIYDGFLARLRRVDLRLHGPLLLRRPDAQVLSRRTQAARGQ